MTIRNRQDAPPSRSPITCAAGSKSLRPHLVFLGLILMLLPFLPAMPSQAQTGTPAIAIPKTYFGMMFNKTSSFPLAKPISYGMDRLWDTSAQWANLQIAAGTTPGDFNWPALETLLRNDYNDNSQTSVLYTLGGRTPNWALGLAATCTSNPRQPACDTTCAGYHSGGKTTGASAPGQCYPPADLNPDGSGTDQTWINWVTAFATEAVKLCNAGGYACIRYYEIWNEIDNNGQGYAFPGSSYAAPYMFGSTSPIRSGHFYYGSFAQLVRMTQDARCYIKGRTSLKAKGNVPYAIDNMGGAGVAGSCPQVVGIQPDALIVSPSSHAIKAVSLNTIRNLFYCSVPGTTTGAPNWCNTGSDEAAAIDVVNFHMKPGNQPDGFDVEQEMLSQYCTIVGNGATECSGKGYTGILQPAELAKPFWNTEAGYSGFEPDSWDGGRGTLKLGGNPDMQAAFIGRYALIQWSLGIQNFNWYTYDIGNKLNGTSYNGSGTQAGDPALAYTSMYHMLVGQTMSTSCAADGNGPDGTQWSCGFAGANGWVGMAVWDTNSRYGCNPGSTEGSGCTYYWTSAPGKWTYYRDLWGNETAIPTTGQHAHQVQVSNLPIMLENQQL